MLLTALLVNIQNQPMAAKTLKDVWKLQPSFNMTFGNTIFEIDLANIVASESDNHDNRLSSSHWSIRQALHHCSLIRHGSHYKVYLHGALLCLEQYYQFCIRGNAVAQVQELKSQYASECMQFRFSETTPSQNARIWDIHVPLGFHINLTVTNLQMNYHPRGHCYGNLVKDGRYTGQGLAIDNYTTVCQRTKDQSYFLPMSKARIILNYTRFPDHPDLEFMYQTIIPQASMKSYLTLLKSTFLNMFYFDLFQNTKSHVIIYVKTHVRLAISLMNVTLRCENNFNRGNKLNFIDGPIFFATSYLQAHAFIASLVCETLASNTTNSSRKGNNRRYLYLEQVKASIGDITAVLKGQEIDISTLDFSFRTHLPDPPYGNINMINFTTAEPGTSESLIAEQNLPVQGRHFHVQYLLQKSNPSFQSKPRLIFRIKEFDMVSFRDGCHTGGIFIAVGYTTIASYCSQAGITFLNSTSETGGILFGDSPLVLLLKGYYWFANIKLNISVLYDSCVGVTNICDKFRDHYPMFPNKCRYDDDVLCRYVAPTPCIEFVRLPSDGLLDYSTECNMRSHLNPSPYFGYIHFSATLLMTFAIRGHLELPEVFPVIYPEYVNYHMDFPFFSSREHETLQLNKKYGLQSESLIINIKNTYPWLGIGHWIRIVQIPACKKEAVSLQPLESLQILRGCGALGVTSVTPHAKISIDRSVFLDSLYYAKAYQALYVAIFLLGAGDISNCRAEGLFNAKIQSFVGGLHKHIVYTKRQYLEINIFSQSPSQEFSIELEWSCSLDRLQFTYIRRPEKLVHKGHTVWSHSLHTSWILVKQREMCSRGTSSCYRYHQSRDIISDATWSMAQAQCAEENSNLISINSPEEWHLLLRWAYNFNWTEANVVRAWVANFEAFKGRLLFIGQRRIGVSNIVDFLSCVRKKPWKSKYHGRRFTCIIPIFY